MKTDCAIFTAYDDNVPYDISESERGLMFAILRSAIEDISRSGQRSREALAYILSEDEYYPFSFVSICAHLNVCPKALRRRLRRRQLMGLVGLEPEPKMHDR